MSKGLGLAIAKGIVLQHQGDIWAESKLGIGSTFYFTLPLQTAASFTQKPALETEGKEG